MKRRIALLLLVLSLLTAFAVPALALAENETTEQTSSVQVDPLQDLSTTLYLTDDLMTVYRQGQTYVRFNAALLNSYFEYGTGNDSVILTESQKKTIKNAYFGVHSSDSALRVELEYFDGVTMQIYYIRQDLTQTYQTLLQTDDCIVDFKYYLDDTILDLPLDAARGTEEVLFDIYDYKTFEVTAEDGVFEVRRGCLLIDGDQYYYVDYNEVGTDELYRLERFRAWHITDEALCAQIDKVMEEYYGSDLGWLESEDFSEQVSKALLIFLFVVIPGAVLILFLILAIRAKTPVYKKLFWNLCIWSALVLVVAATVILIVQLN